MKYCFNFNNATIKKVGAKTPNPLF